MREVEITLFDEEVGDIYDEGEKISSRTVYARLRKCGQREYYSARQNRFEPDFVAEVWGEEYCGERFAEIDGRTYSIYRSFDNESSGKLELYLTKNIGSKKDRSVFK